jgi:predicted secreted protein
MSIEKGTDIMIYVTVGGSLKSVAYATNHTLQIGSNSSEISTKDSGGGLWNEAAVQKLNWSATTENLYSVDGQGAMYDDLFDIMTSRTPVTIKFGIKAAAGSNPAEVPAGGWTAAAGVRTGQAFITDLALNAPNAENASFTATFTGNGGIQ